MPPGQLRHDNILYAKPPYSPPVVCEYPDGYVEPYPAFVAAVGRYAHFGRELFESLQLDVKLAMTYKEAEQQAEQSDWSWIQRERFLRPYQFVDVYEKTRAYFTKLESIATRLEGLARKELDGETFTEEDKLFFRSIVVRKYIGDTHYGGYTEEDWDGWYNDLLPFGDETPQIVADVYTNVDAELGSPGRLPCGYRRSGHDGSPGRILPQWSRRLCRPGFHLLRAP